jgi:hypothetical protein
MMMILVLHLEGLILKQNLIKDRHLLVGDQV